MNQLVKTIHGSPFSIRQNFSKIANDTSSKMRHQALQRVDNALLSGGFSEGFTSDQEKIQVQKIIVRVLKGKLSDTATIRSNLNHILQNNAMKNGIVSTIVSALNEWGHLEKMPNRFQVSFTDNRRDETSNIVIIDRANNDAIIIESSRFAHSDVHYALKALNQHGLRAFVTGPHGAVLHSECLTPGTVGNSHALVQQRQNESESVFVGNSPVSVKKNQNEWPFGQVSEGNSQDGWESSQDDRGNSQWVLGSGQGSRSVDRALDGSIYYDQMDLYLNTCLVSPQKNEITKQVGFIYYGNVNIDNQPNDPSGTLILLYDNTMYNEEPGDIDSQSVITVEHKVAFFYGPFLNGYFEDGAKYHVKYATDLVHDPQYVSRFSGILFSKQAYGDTLMYHYTGKLDNEGFPKPLKGWGVPLV